METQPLVNLVLGLMLVCLIVYCGWLMNSVADDLFLLRARRRFQADLTLAFINNRAVLTWGHIVQMAETRGITQHQIHRTLKILLREILAGRNLSLVKERETIERYISKIKEAEPFEGLPDEVRIHLERLRDGLGENAQKLEPLTVQIRELVAINAKDRRLQRYYSVGGFVIGVVGLLFAAYAYWVPPSVGEASVEQSRSIRK